MLPLPVAMCATGCRRCLILLTEINPINYIIAIDLTFHSNARSQIGLNPHSISISLLTAHTHFHTHTQLKGLWIIFGIEWERRKKSSNFVPINVRFHRDRRVAYSFFPIIFLWIFHLFFFLMQVFPYLSLLFNQKRRLFYKSYQIIYFEEFDVCNTNKLDCYNDWRYRLADIVMSVKIYFTTQVTIFHSDHLIRKEKENKAWYKSWKRKASQIEEGEKK